MGFEVEIARKALKRSGNDVYKALDLLKDECIDGLIPEAAIITGSKFLPSTNNKIV